VLLQDSQGFHCNGIQRDVARFPVLGFWQKQAATVSVELRPAQGELLAGSHSRIQAEIEAWDVLRGSLRNRVAQLRLFCLGEPPDSAIVLFGAPTARGWVFVDLLVFNPDAESQAKGGLPTVFCGRSPLALSGGARKPAHNFLLADALCGPRAKDRLQRLILHLEFQRRAFAVICSAVFDGIGLKLCKRQNTP